MRKRNDGLSHMAFHPAMGANLCPFGAPPSRGRREKSQSLPLEGKCVSNRWKMRVPRSSYCHFERSEKSSLHTGQTKDVRGAVNTVLHTTWNDGLPHMHCFPACKKDPPAALGMTKRGTGCLTFHLIPLREPTSAPSGHLLPKEGGRSSRSFPPWGRQRNENTAAPHQKPSPRGEGAPKG